MTIFACDECGSYYEVDKIPVGWSRIVVRYVDREYVTAVFCSDCTKRENRRREEIARVRARIERKALGDRRLWPAHEAPATTPDGYDAAYQPTHWDKLSPHGQLILGSDAQPADREEGDYRSPTSYCRVRFTIWQEEHGFWLSPVNCGLTRHSFSEPHHIGS